jgi:hypothetical protein
MMTDLAQPVITVADLVHMHEAIAASLDINQPGNNDWRFAALGAYTEIGEIFANLPWRPWRSSDSRKPTQLELDLALPEIADAVGALLRCVVNLGINAEAFEAACLKHVQTKYERLSNGHDR